MSFVPSAEAEGQQSPAFQVRNPNCSIELNTYGIANKFIN
jgi:hypothetical protein